jgi:non-canonical (house-cleaning) NTP pyrophosphatase
MDDVLDREGVAREGGAAGAFSDGATDREAALSSAVAGALGPFLSDLY